MLKFVSGYLTEYSLSVDNLFVFLMIFSMMGVGLTLTLCAGMVAPSSTALIGFLMFGNLIRECGVPLDTLMIIGLGCSRSSSTRPAVSCSRRPSTCSCRR